MTKMVVFLMLFLPSVFDFSPASDMIACNCNAVSNVEKTGQTGDAVSYEWDGPQGATQYKVWYTRQQDQYTSSYFYTLTPTFTFANLSPGTYTFNIVAICNGNESSWIGIEEVIQQ